MSRKLKNSIKFSASEERTDHSEKVENKIKELVVVVLSAVTNLDKRDEGVIL